MWVHREIKREIGCLTLRAIFDVGYVLRAFRVGLAEGLAGRNLFSGKNLSERQDLNLRPPRPERVVLSAVYCPAHGRRAV
jgi:hypothetical protein